MSSPGLINEDIRESTSLWWLVLLVGLLYIVAGVIVLAKPSDSLSTLAVIVGIFVLIAGVFDLIGALSRRTESRGMAAILGVLGVVVGVLLIRHPFHGVLAVALLIGIWLLAVGVVRLVAAFEREHRAWNIVLALIEMAAGIVLVSSPSIAFATLALIVGISFIVNGVATMVLGWMVHVVHREAADGAVDAGVTA